MSLPLPIGELISLKAPDFANKVIEAASRAKNEAEVRFEVVKQLAFIEKEAGIELDVRHEFTVASGRVDSVYQRVIVEYKNPKSKADRIRPKSVGTERVVEQIKSRFRDLERESGQPLNGLLGIGLDGTHFVFVRYLDGRWSVEDTVPVDTQSSSRFLWALFNLGRKGKAFTPEQLAEDFGSDSRLALDGIHVLYEAICSTSHPKAVVFFKQWKILFGEVCGYEVDNPTEKLKKLAKFYNVPVKGFKPAELFFAVHTYYALFMKLLASEIVASAHRLPKPLQRILRANSKSAFRREMLDFESGSIFRHLNITNFLEGDLFSWYLPLEEESIEELVRNMVRRLDDFNPDTLDDNPVGSRDLLKKLYQELFPKSVRHDLGEYYTPDWLADHSLTRVGYVGDPDKRFLDPACGSGTFLVMAINRVRKWYEAHRESCKYGESELGRKILENVVGFDLNPLAVMAARTNYLIAIRDLIGHLDRVELPVYLCDSVMTPSTYGGLFGGPRGTARELRTAAAKFIIPTEIAKSKEDVAKYAEMLERGVENGWNSSVFVDSCRDAGLVVSEEKLHSDLYRELVRLDKANKNGIWARIIKNAFAPIFAGRMDFIAGNPPWVNYENLPEEYREAGVEVWKKYGLFPTGGWRARFAKGNTELAMLFVYACLDEYCSRGGKMSFVITQSIFQSKEAGRGFRRFRIGPDKPIRVMEVDDFSAMQPFDGATNRTSVITLDTEAETSYPVKYNVWRLKEGMSFDSGASLSQVTERTILLERVAAPVGDELSPWCVVPDSQILSVIKKVTNGVSGYRAWKGADTRGGNGLFWLQLLKSTATTLLCRNTPEFSRKDPPQLEWGFEKELVFPLLRGRETSRWLAAPTLYLLFPHEQDHAIPAKDLARRFPKTFAYFQELKPHLEQRRMFDLSRRKLEFYSLFETGPFLLAPYKLVWKYIASELTCAVIGPASDGTLPANTPVIPDHKLVVVPFEEPEPAHYLCAMMNSSVARCAASAYTVGTQISTHVLEFLKIPPYSSRNKKHVALSKLSIRAHQYAIGGRSTEKLEARIDKLAAQVWHLTPDELKSASESCRQSTSAVLDETDD